MLPSHEVVKVENPCCIALHTDRRFSQRNLFYLNLFLQKRQKFKAHLNRPELQKIFLREFRVVCNAHPLHLCSDSTEDGQFYFLEIHIPVNLLLYARDNGAFVFIQVDNMRSK